MKKDRINIIYEDKEIIVVDKPSNLLTISTNNEKEETLFHKVMLYLKGKNKNNKVFIVHRLDRDTSGIVLFAKSEKLKHSFQDKWNDLVKNREYIAYVSPSVKEKSKIIKSYLKETSTLMVYSSNDSKNGKLAITEYKEISRNRNGSLLKINIKTGRKNQIRVHMKDIGSPVVGDKKYGSKNNSINRLGLHASKLEIIHPITKKVMVFESKPPLIIINKFK